MRTDNVIQFWVYDGSSWVDYSNGLINATVNRGVQEYEGPYSQPDVGILTLISRNENLDPYNNSFIRYNNFVRITANGSRIYTGKIDGIDVEYQPRGNPPIVTITAIDLVGSMQKHVLSDNFIKQRVQNWSTFGLIQDIESTQEVQDFQCPVRITTGTAYVNSSINSGETAWSALASRAATDLGFCYADAQNVMSYYRLPYDDSRHPNNFRNVKATFSHSGDALSYRTIALNDGFEKITNNLVVTGNIGEWTGASPYTWSGSGNLTTVESSGSQSLWGKAKRNISVLTTNSTSITAIGNAIFEEMANPLREVYRISWDGMLAPDTAKEIDIMDNIVIDHATTSVAINRKYAVVGIVHQITPDDWNITYTLRNWNFKDTAFGDPVISATPASGDQYVDYTYSFTLDEYNEIASVYWDLDEGFTSTSFTPTVNYVNAGTKNVTLTVTNIYGWVKTATFSKTIGASPPINSFTYELDVYNQYEFTFTGEEAVSYLWDFGDGSTSTAKNPKKFYTIPGTYTVSCSATNVYGTSTSSQTFTPNVVIQLPVRYVKFGLFSYNWNQTLTSNFIYGLHAGTSTTNYALNKTPIVKEYIGFHTNAQGTSPATDTYGRYIIQNMAPGSSGPAKLTDGNNTTGVKWSLLYPNTGNTNTDNVLRCTYTIDLQDPYFDIDTFYLRKDGIAGADNGDIKVAVSYDNVNWYDAGYCRTDTTDVITPFVSTATLPVSFSFPIATWVSDDDIYEPIRYIKAVTNDTSFTISEMIVQSSGLGQAGDYDSSLGSSGFGSFFRTHMFGFGGYNYTYDQGANITNQSEQSVYGIPSGTYPNNSYVGGKLNDRTKTTNIYWTDNLSKTFLIDLGRDRYDVSQIVVYTKNSSGVTTTTSANNITFYYSQDGITWKTFGTLVLGATTGLNSIYNYNPALPSNYVGRYEPIRKTGAVTAQT